ncbi:Linoleate 13S-lipoxygenase 2-1, chloroplastic [Vitis vinifera]|uniref:Lipoxygenase n=1 Tax=Vitis vinifera TaxID=29760 RepID=A0A438JVM3_VITVI|nr:Linoleate 13S-lipoxygenase 2-1, chloroplastic [Vitis vinifera]
MFKTQVHQSHTPPTFFLLNKPCIPGPGTASFSVRPRPEFRKKYRNVRVGYVPANIKAVASDTDTRKSVSVKATVTVKLTVGGFLSSLIGLSHGLDDVSDWLGKTLLLEVVSSEVDPKTGLEKKPIGAYAHRAAEKDGEVTYESDFVIPDDFGEIGAVLVQNEHHKEMYLRYIVLDGFPNGPIEFNCSSWVASKFDDPQKRVFFTNKSYLPLETPSGLKEIREKELVTLRGNGQGERKSYDRIYDYDVYDDLGDPDSSPELTRPVLGGSKQYPYPRRCRTGRPMSKIDPKAETRSSTVYVPRDEAFSDVKELTFSTNTLYSALHAVVPAIESVITDTSLGFPLFTKIDELYNQGINVPNLKKHKVLQDILPRLVRAITNSADGVLQFETPQLLLRDKFSWFRDEEFSRQTLAGLNPYSIQLVKEWPLKSTLDPKIYGPPESAITTEIVEREIKGFMTVDEALKQKNLFIIDYHDILLPYVSEVRQIKGTTLYGSRALFFLGPDNTLKPLAIELVRPPMDGKPQWKQVFTPSWEATGSWLWKLAKTHFLAHDTGYHQLVSHWLRTHCVTEPYIIATNRQLSAMHPIYRLLQPHFRYTMEINALAREALINADGIIESAFTPGKYSIEISSAAYGLQWRFDTQGLPADLISRGIAVEDASSPHGLKLAIPDYPFANDGLLLWDAIKEWVTDYVNFFYKDASMVKSDAELQEWWTEIRTRGHEDKKDETWWPDLKTPQDLIGIVTTMVWVTSGHHAAVNFGQYAYAGYFPNRPTIARTNLPSEDPTEEGWRRFLHKPEDELLACLPTQLQAAKVLTVLDVLSSHSPDEEYLGEYLEPAWGADPLIKAAFERFSGRLKEIEGIIDARNEDKNLKNRHGAGVVPYELLKPFSGAGVTGKGVPYSISI